jgi:hypothetical protein
MFVHALDNALLLVETLSALHLSFVSGLPGCRTSKPLRTGEEKPKSDFTGLWQTMGCLSSFSTTPLSSRLDPFARGGRPVEPFSFLQI